MSDFYARLKRRKIFQWAAAYAGGAWLLLQLLALVAQPFAWPDLVMRAAIVVLAVGFVRALVLAWFHGEKGQQRASGIELVMLAALLVVAGAGVTIVSRGRARPREASTPVASTATATSRSIAVLPFDNLSNDPENEYFSDGITEDILNNLSKIRGLRVTSRTSAMQYKNTDKPTPQIASELKVAHVLEGSVRRAQDRVVINAKLIRAETDEQLWSERYERALTDIFAVQSEIATEIASALNMRLSPAESQNMAVKPTSNMEAYDLYMRARADQLRWTVVTLQRSVQLLRDAIRLDPQFVQATALLARSYSGLALSRSALSDSAEYYGRLAVERGPQLADTHNALGEVLRSMGQYDEASRHFARALEIDPNHGWTISETGELLAWGQGRVAEGISYFERALLRDPANPFSYSHLARAYAVLGYPERALDVIARGLRVVPHDLFMPLESAEIYLARNDTVSALRELEAMRVPGTGRYYANVVLVFIHTGHRELARRAASQIPDSLVTRTTDPHFRMVVRYARGESGEARAAAAENIRDNERQLAAGNQDPWVRYEMAQASMVLNEREKAIAAIEEFVRLGGRGEARIRNNVLFAPLQREPRIQRVLETIGRDIAAQRKQLEARAS